VSISSAVTQYNFTVGNETVVVFNGTPGSINFSVPQGVTSAWYLIIAGGGGGGGSRTDGFGAGGGGGGGLLNGTTLINGTINITIGQGGDGGEGGSSNKQGITGTNSSLSINNLSAKGGGGGGSHAIPNGLTGGSGGGSAKDGTAGTGISGQGYNGGTGYWSAPYRGGGGGGSGQAGTDGSGGGNGGNGQQINITGILTYYAGGGGGGSSSGGTYTVGIGGLGGGGNGGNNTAPTSGIDGLGGGGGGAGYGAGGPGGNGGDGIIIFKYTTPTLPPVANFTMSNATGISPLLVNFTDTSTESPTTWNWTFGGSNFSSAQNPSYTFTGAGNYTVILNASNSAGFSNITKYINVFEPPVANFTMSNSSGSFPLLVNFTDTSTNTPTGWNWSFNGTNFSDAQYPNFIFTGVGNYSVTLNASNSAGFSNMTKYVNVTYPSLYCSIPTGSSVYTNNVVTCIWDGSGTYLRYTRDYPAFSGQNIYLLITPEIVNTPGTYNFTLVYPGMGGLLPGSVGSTNGMAITVMWTQIYQYSWIGNVDPNSPTSNFTMSNTSGISSVLVNFTDTSVGVGIFAWNWSFNGTNFSSNQNPSYTFTGAGNYSVNLTVSNVSGCSSIVKYINVFEPPVANFTMSNITGFSPLLVNFTDTSTNTPTAWNWTFGGANFSNAQYPNYTFTGAGNYTIILNASNADGFSNITKYVNVSNPPNPPMSIENLTYTLGDYGGGIGNSIFWEWNNPDGELVETGYSISIWQNNTFLYTLTAGETADSWYDLSPNTSYTISTKTFNSSGINETWVNSTAMTDPPPTPTPTPTPHRITIEDKMNDAQGFIVIGIYLMIGTVLVALVAKGILGSSE